ncbi:LEAF RUST 10 DISEASE-RESISTANCE LOCUS RECEPTOR-LIKE PROTEIN KINASE-like 1.2 isoform X2 [Magnolia sinica]|uniref:LEAF RUST 10 DISEASE-RESISTANCE LOCUS RECEPTOR-LIKE PROTEIN KINASE-like 1.2 isoform X2 n=1 Tax=Magnolia sinica TaxID=86752 RepID=UPI002658C1BB|nr:LEAF RUST 10 DISEASE-RESISTANCE LOCUS RECEPTOR-LIKE PROTEIN KINASE-like 1.2 isoform X2 [Magnolia sinica]
MSHPYHLLFSFLLFLFLTKTNGNPVNSSIPNCPSPTCGNLTIKYPFWLSSQNPDFCGYPSFNFTCNNQQKLIFHLPNDSYYVTNINYSRNTLTLVDIDVIGKTCPRARHNVSLEPVIPHLNYSALDENLTFYFNCTDYHSLDGDLPCLSNDQNHSFMFRAGSIPEFDWFRYCEDCVVAPVLESEANVMSTGAFGGVLEKGFELGWSSVLNCAACEESEGYCGNNKSNGEFICFCKDGPHPRSCYREDASLRSLCLLRREGV